MKALPTLQLAMFVGSWVASWVSLFFNSSQMAFGGHGLDVLYVAPVMVLLLGLFMTNLQGYLEEQESDPGLARAAIWDADMAVLIHRHGRDICAGKPPKAWNQLKNRQALGRGIPLSMVSFYLASRHLIEAPVCRLTSPLSRDLIICGGQWNKELSLLLPFLERHRQICSFDLPFGHGWNCTSSEALNQPFLLVQMQQQFCGVDGGVELGAERIKELQESESSVWDAAHCEQSAWMLQPAPPEVACGYEFSANCITQARDTKPGPMQAFNRFMGSQLVPLLTANANMVKAVRKLAAASMDNWALQAGVKILPESKIADLVVKNMQQALKVDYLGRVLLISWRQWQIQIVIGLASLLMSVQPLANAIVVCQRLKPAQKRLLLIHLSLDILILECAAVCILNAKAIVHFGADFWQAVQAALDAFSQTLTQLNSLSDLTISVYADVNDMMPRGPKLFRNSIDGIKVGPGAFASFFVSALVIYSLSTCLLGANSITRRLPLVSRWNAAVGGPLQLLSVVPENEVRGLCQGVRWQILLRTLLLSVLLAVFLLPATSFSVGLLTSLVLQVTVFKTPFVIAWLVLSMCHIGTGMLAVQSIADKQPSRDQRRRLKDMEAAVSAARLPPPYGTFPSQAIEPGASTRAPLRPPGVEVHAQQAPAAPPGIRWGLDAA